MNSKIHINSVVHLFDPLRLKLARELRGMKKGELASAIGKTPSAISQFELGKSKPDTETALKLAWALSVPPTFFSHGHGHAAHISVEDCHFRSLRTASQKDRRQLLAVGSLLSDLISTLEESVRLPAVNIPELEKTVESNTELELCAEYTRKKWGLGLGPIPDMVRLVESEGIVVCPLLDGSEKVDAFSYWHKNRPFIFLLLGKGSSSRSRFDVAHELGHLIMHADVAPGDPNAERQANRFASAFLMPRESFLRECPTRLNMAHFFELKRRWRVSVAALLRRAFDLGCIGESSYRRGNIQLNALGLHYSEPDEPPRERPNIIRQAVEIALSEGGLEQLAENSGIPVKDLTTLIHLQSLSDMEL